MYNKYWQSVYNSAASLIDDSLKSFEDDFAPVPPPQSDLWELLLIQLLTLGLTAVAAPFFDVCRFSFTDILTKSCANAVQILQVWTFLPPRPLPQSSRPQRTQRTGSLLSVQQLPRIWYHLQTREFFSFPAPNLLLVHPPSPYTATSCICRACKFDVLTRHLGTLGLLRIRTAFPHTWAKSSSDGLISQPLC